MNRLTLLVLTVLALGIWANALVPLIRPQHVKAGESMRCKGEINVNVYGPDKPSLGGYDFNVSCY